MIKYDCNMIKDLLPFYNKNELSETDKNLIKEHLEKCEECKKYWQGMQEEISLKEVKKFGNGFNGFRKTAEKISWKKRVSFLISVLVLITCFLLISGYRFTSWQAANSYFMLDKSSEYLAETDYAGGKIYFFENEDKYYTVIAEKKLFLWKSNCGFWANKNKDSIRLIGLCSINNDKKPVTAVSIESFDKKVKYIEMGDDGCRVKKYVKSEAPIIFLWDDVNFSSLKNLNAIAYSAEGKPLYKLSSRVENNVNYRDDIHWYPVIKNYPIKIKK